MSSVTGSDCIVGQYKRKYYPVIDSLSPSATKLELVYAVRVHTVVILLSFVLLHYFVLKSIVGSIGAGDNTGF